MDDNELKSIWKDYDRRLEEARVLNLQSWALNLQCFETLQRQKITSKLGKLAVIKVVIAAVGIIWVLFLGFLVLHSLQWPKIFFTASVGILFLFNVYAVVEYIRHLVLIRQINNSETIVHTQLKLAELQSATLRVTRILFLQIPFYTTFYYSPQWIMSGDPGFWLITLPVTGLLTLAAIWLYRNISYRNADKKWFKMLFAGPEWNYVLQSAGFIKEIEEFKRNI